MLTKTLTLITLLTIPFLSHAETFSEKRAKNMIAVLQSDEIKTLLQQEYGVGNITGINYANSLTTDDAERFAVDFLSHFGTTTTKCSTIARVDGTNGNITLSPVSCDQTLPSPKPSKDCKNPTPIGCAD